MAQCRECRMTEQHKLGCSRRRQSGSYVKDVDASGYNPLIDYGSISDSGSSCDSGSSSCGGE